MENRTEAKEFILLGLTSNPDLQVPLFITFLLIYIITLVGNLGMILLILMDSRLHTPMYYFLGTVSGGLLLLFSCHSQGYGGAAHRRQHHEL
jgi:olfactory receptor